VLPLRPEEAESTTWYNIIVIFPDGKRYLSEDL
jgi:hypothetical protein